MRRWLDVSVEAASSRRRIAVAIGVMARAGYWMLATSEHSSQLLRRASMILTIERIRQTFSDWRPYRYTYLLGSSSQICCVCDNLSKFQSYISDLYGIEVFQECNNLIPQNCAIKCVVALVLKGVDICE